ncbi:MAG: hypothetical protein HY434_00020 [Candidatus Liptonbacteria bacterium]|nr:hypothetical protein [Candidatus Liptonbacteria bacterium]
MNDREKIPVESSEEAQEVRAARLLRDAERELVANSLTSREGIEGLEAWRGVDDRGKATRGMRRFFDKLSAYDAAIRKSPQAKDAIAGEIRKSATSVEEAPTRQDELERLFLAKKLGEGLPEVRREVQRVFDSLSHVSSSEGEVDVAELLSSSRVALKTKSSWLESQLLSGLKVLERKDLADARRKAEAPPSDEILQKKEEAPTENVPPSASDSFRPSMEETGRSKEGEPGAFFTIAPFYGGYYKEGDYDAWNPKTLSWERRGRSLQELETTALDEKTRRVIAGTVRPSVQTALPMPYGFYPDVSRLKIYPLTSGGVGVHGGGKVKILEDGRGGYILDTRGEKLTSFSVELGRGVISQPEKEGAVLKIDSGKLSKDTESKLDEVKKLNVSPFEKARLLKAYVRQFLRYSNESAMNAVYQGGNPKEYFKRIEEHKKADCDVANTYFAALLSRLLIPVRMVTGHYVKVKDRSGNAAISSGTGHAWVEVWDGGSWQKLDATPPGDPNMDDEEMDENKDDSALEGDFAEQEAEEISNEELEKLIDEAKAELGKKEDKKGEVSALRFAEDAGCTPEEAKEILRQIDAARELRDRRGRKIRDRIVSEFQKIIKENSVERSRYKAPVRLSDAHELADPVEAALDIEAGEAEPGGFAKYEQKTEREQIYGGFDAIFVVDKSGSMGETDPKSGSPKWKEQQKFVFVFMDALYFTAQEFKRERIRLISPIDIRSGLVSFQAGGAAIELPLGSKWGPKEQYQVWKALQKNVGGGTPDHLGLGSVQKIIEEDIAQNPQEKKRLRLVIVGADGGSDSTSATMQAKESLKSVGAVVKAAGIGAGAKEVEATYYPDGKNLESFEELPDFAAEEVIAEARKLYPKKVKR